MNFQLATLDDLAQLSVIMADAIAFLKEQGSPQWQAGYGPTADKLAVDIQNKRTYVLKMNNDEIAGTIALISGIDPVYTKISQGVWEGQDDYLAFHRVAINKNFRGQKITARLLEEAMNQAYKLGFKDLRIDTHEQNVLMQKAIKSAGFTYRGRVQFPIPNGDRLAYQKRIK